MKFWKRWLPFLFVNILISTATTLIVLTLWTRANPSQQITLQPVQNSQVNQTQINPQATLPSLDTPLIEISNVFATGNLDNEYIVLDRVGSGDLDLTNWKITDDKGNEFVFPSFEFLQGQLEVYSRNGVNTPNKLFWNADKAIWNSGETIFILDSAGQQRAEFTIP